MADHEELRARVNEADAVIAEHAGSTDEADRLQVIEALSDKGQALIGLKAYEDALVSLDRALQLSDETAGGVLDEQLATVLARKARVCRLLGQVSEVEAVSDQLIERFGEAEDVQLYRAVMAGLLNRCQALEAAGRFSDIVLYASELMRRADDLSPPDSQYGRVARVRLATALRKVGDQERALGLYKEIVELYGNDMDPETQATVGTITWRRADLLRTMGRLEEAAAAFESFVRSYSDTTNARIRGLVATALVQQAAVLAQLHRFDDALVVLEEAGRRGGDLPPAQSIRMEINAWNLRALLFTATDRYEEAADAYDHVIDVAVETKTSDGEIPGMDVRQEILGARVSKATLGLGRGDISGGRAESVLLCHEFEIEEDSDGSALYGTQLLRLAAAFTSAARLGQSDDAATASEAQVRGWHLLLTHIRAAGRESRDRRRPFISEALQIYEVLIGRIEQTARPDLRLLVVDAQLRAHFALLSLGRLRAAGDLIEDLLSGGPPVIDALEQIGSRDDQGVGAPNRLWLAGVAGLRAAAISRHGDRRAAQQALDETAQRFRDDTSPRVRANVWIFRTAIVPLAAPSRLNLKRFLG